MTQQFPQHSRSDAIAIPAGRLRGAHGISGVNGGFSGPFADARAAAELSRDRTRMVSSGRQNAGWWILPFAALGLVFWGMVINWLVF